MQRNCDACGRPYEARDRRSKTCGDTCRKRLARGVRPAAEKAAAQERAGSGPLERAAIAKLQAAERLETDLGALAVTLARKIDAPTTMESAVASLSKEFRVVMVEAMDGVAVAADPLDELRARRDARRAG